VSREVAHSVLSYFRSKTHLLHAIPDLAVITSSEINNVLQEGSVHNADVTMLIAQVCNAEKGPEKASNKDDMDGTLCYGAKAADISNLHVDEDSAAAVSTHHMSAADADVEMKSTSNMTCDAISGLLLQYIASSTTISKSGVSSKTAGSPFGTLLNAMRSLLQPMVSISEHVQNMLVVLAGLNIVRNLFYEAQVRYAFDRFRVIDLRHLWIGISTSRMF